MKQELKMDELAQVVGGAAGATDNTSMETELRKAWNALGFAAHGMTEHMFEEYLDEFTAGGYVPAQAMEFLTAKKTW